MAGWSVESSPQYKTSNMDAYRTAAQKTLQNDEAYPFKAISAPQHLAGQMRDAKVQLAEISGCLAQCKVALS